MQRKEKNEIYSIRKFKVGVGSALIGLSFLGATGLLDDVPIVSDVFGVETAHAAEGDTRTIEVTWLEAHSFKELGKNQATSVDNGDGTFTTTFTALPGHFAPKKVRLYQHEFSDKINVVAYDWLGSNVPDHDGPDNTKPSDFGLTDVFGKPTAYLINADQLDGKKMTPVFYFTPKSYADGSRGFMLARAIGTKSTTSEKVLKATTRYEKDDTREKGAENVVAVAAKDGKEVTTTSYVFRKKDGSLVEPMFNDAKVNPNDLTSVNPDDYVTGTPKTTTEAPVNGVIKVAAKDKVVYSKKGNDVIKSTTVYTVNPDNGSITEKTTEEVIKANGAKDTVATTPIPSPKRYEKDATREKGQPNIETKGTDGVSSITTTYTVNPQTGATNVTAGQPVVTKQATDTVIKVAAKDKVVRESKPSPIRYEKDVTREKGSENITVKGKDGETVIKVAAKDKVETIRQNGDTIERSTKYMVNPETGKVTEEVTDKLISSNGLGIKPPVAENNNANENTSVTDKLEHKDIVSSNGSDENGNVIKPLVNEKPEYKGVDANENGNSSVTDKPENNVSSENTNVENNNADEHTSVSDKSENNGNVVKPLVNEKPEFDLSTLEKEPKKTIDVKTVSNDFGPKKDTKKDEFNFIPVNDDKTSVTKSSEKPGSEKPVSQLPNTAGGNNAAINALGALTLTSVLGLAATKRKKEN